MSDLVQRMKAALLSLVPSDGSPIGNTALRREAEARLQSDGLSVSEADYWLAHADLIADGSLLKGQGRGGSVRLATKDTEDFSLAHQDAPAPEQHPANASKPATLKATQPATKRPTDEAPQIISYRHQDKRKNNPEVGMVTPVTDPEAGKTRWAFDPHLDPILQFNSQRGRIEAIIDDALASGDTERMRSALEELKHLQTPYLNWAGKAERASFDVDTVSLHVHERVDPAASSTRSGEFTPAWRCAIERSEQDCPDVADKPWCAARRRRRRAVREKVSQGQKSALAGRR